jgi:hypothetical protein
MPHPVADIFNAVAQLNRQDARRHGNMVHVPEDIEIVLAGDIHGRRGNLNKIISFAALGKHAKRMLILQELIHGPADEKTGVDRSIELLMRAARLKKQFPEQVILLLSNHDLAQASGKEISKGGIDSCAEFVRGVEASFGEATEEIMASINAMLLTQPLAVKCANRVFISHSLPSPNRMAAAGYEILSDPPNFTQEMLVRGGPVYEWVWGRAHTPAQVERIANALHVDFFLMGHQPTPNGWELTTPQSMVVMSDLQMGFVSVFNTSEPFGRDQAVESLTPIYRMEE